MAFALVLIFLLSSPAYAGYQNLAIAAGQSDFYYDAPKNQTFARFAANDPIYNAGTQTVNTTRPYNVVGIDGKTYQTTITRTAAADIPKVGAALSKFAQRVGPLAMGIATIDLICSLSNICKSAAGVFEKSTSLSAVDGAKTHIGWCVSNGGGTPCYSDKNFDDAVYQANACLQSANSNCVVDGVREKFSGSTLIGLEYRFRFKSDGSYSSYYPATFIGTYVPPAPTSQPTTPSDWTTAETALSTPAAAERLAVELEPLPIQVPSAYTPLQLPIGRITITNRDAIGNATGTKVTEKKLEIEDAATLQEPNRSKIEEISTETTFDLNGNPVSSTETKTETATQTEPQPEKPPVPENIEIDFDESQDKTLEKFEVPSLFSYTSWGSGSCPADAVEDTKFGAITLSYAPVCEVAEGVRPFVILLALIGAFFIVSGSRT